MVELSVLLFDMMEMWYDMILMWYFMGCFQAEPSKDSESLRFAKQQRMGGKNRPKDGEWFLRSHFWPIKPHLSSLALLTHLLPYETLVLFRGEMRHSGSGPLHPSCGDSCSMKQLHQHKWLFIGTLLIIVFLGSESCRMTGRAKQMIIESASNRSLLPLYNISFAAAAADLTQELGLHQHWHQQISVMQPWSVPVNRSQQCAWLLMLAPACALPRDARELPFCANAATPLWLNTAIYQIYISI